MVANARIIDESQLDTSKILIHSVVKLKNTSNKMEFTYTLVADSESDVRNGKLSVNSPIGKGLLGKKIGEIAEIQWYGMLDGSQLVWHLCCFNRCE